LPDVRGGQGQLADFLAHGPVVLSFYRGGWCPFCNLEFKALADILPAINAAGATLVGISPERPEVGQQTVADHGLEFEVLSDVGNLVIRDYGLLMRVDEQMRPHYRQWGIDLFAANGDESYELPVPATYVIDRDGVIRAAHVDRDYTSRMEPADILAALDSI
jgi:peroxiredoxin